MDIQKKIFGKKLVEINKKDWTVKLLFSDGVASVTIKYEGLLFETPLSALNKDVVATEDSYVLGIKAVTELNYQNKNPSEYHQLFIKMGNRDERKCELICAYKNLELLENGMMEFVGIV